LNDILLASGRFLTIYPEFSVTAKPQTLAVQSAASRIAEPTAAGDPPQSQESNFESDGAALHFLRSRGHKVIGPTK
jgi:hypothetical protein